MKSIRGDQDGEYRYHHYSVLHILAFRQRYATNIQALPFWLWLWLGVGKSSCVEAQESSTVESGFEVVCPSSVLARTLWSSEIIEAIQGLLR